MTRQTVPGYLSSAAVVAVWLLCQTSTDAQINGQAAGSYLHTKLFGDYGPVSLITGKPTPRFVNGQRVLPEEGLLSPQMRRTINGLHSREEPSGAGEDHARDFAQLTAQNLTLMVPSGEWTQKPPQAGRPLVLYRKDRRIVVELAANRFGVEAGPTNESILALSQGVLTNSQNSSIAPELYELSAQGVPGLMYRATVRLKDGEQNHSAIWVAAKNGYTYELVVYGDVSTREAIDETLIDFVRNAREKEPNHIAYGREEPSKWRFWR